MSFIFCYVTILDCKFQEKRGSVWLPTVYSFLGMESMLDKYLWIIEWVKEPYCLADNLHLLQKISSDIFHYSYCVKFWRETYERKINKILFLPYRHLQLSQLSVKLDSEPGYKQDFQNQPPAEQMHTHLQLHVTRSISKPTGSKECPQPNRKIPPTAYQYRSASCEKQHNSEWVLCNRNKFYFYNLLLLLLLFLFEK